MTPRQKEVLEAIEAWKLRELRPPTLRELAFVLGVGVTGALDHVVRLERHGWVYRAPGARGLHVTCEGRKAVASAV